MFIHVTLDDLVIFKQNGDESAELLTLMSKFTSCDHSTIIILNK